VRVHGFYYSVEDSKAVGLEMNEYYHSCYEDMMIPDCHNTGMKYRHPWKCRIAEGRATIMNRSLGYRGLKPPAIRPFPFREPI
jgi:hypothetical protein